MFGQLKGTGIARREFLAGTAAVVAAVTSFPESSAAAEKTPKPHAGPPDWTAIRGFNYQPSYGSSGLELWQNFNAATIDRELGLGKKYFPGMNAIRFWLSWDSFRRNPRLFADHFETSLRIAHKHGLYVMPVLFNRWHDSVLDYGGIYVDHFMPKASWVQSPKMFDAYLEAVVGSHEDDPRILAWDLANEPFSYSCGIQEIPQIAQAELNWLKGLYDECKRLGATAPITVGIHPGVPLEKVEPISDLLSIHPYYVHNAPNASKEAFEKSLDHDVVIAMRVRKPLLATECCWGALDDRVRADSIRYTFTQLKKRAIGWMAYLLHHSLIADAHRPEHGPVGFPGYLGFIEADDRLRPGHGVFNEF